MTRPLTLALLVTTSVTAMSAAAHAQTTTASPEGAQVEEVVVTGSRLVVNGAAAPTPVTVVTTQELQARAPTNIADALNQLPQFAGSTSNTRTGWFAGSSANQGNYLSLRNLGTNRVLVMLDGVRVPPTTSSGGVDVNILPQALLQRVDVVTGGASAAYGSDAVSGVVNYIINRNFNGLRASAQAGMSEYGDADTSKFTVAAGRGFLDGRLHLQGSAEYFQQDGVLIEDRPEGRLLALNTGNGSAANPFITYTNVRYNNSAWFGLIATGPLAGQQFNSTGVLIPFNRGTPTGTSTANIGGDGVYFTGQSATASLETKQAYGRVDFALTPTINFHAQGILANSKNVGHGLGDIRFTNGPNSINIFSGNAYLPTAVQSVLTTTNTASFNMGRVNSEVGEGGRFTTRNENEFENINIGFDGELSGTWRWDATYVYGKATRTSKNYETNGRNFYAAVDAVRDASGNVVCRINVTNPGLLPGCVPINLFGANTITPAGVDWITDESIYRIENALSTWNANLRGELFHTWAGPIGVAVGGEYRKQTLEQTSNADPAFPFDRTGIRGVPNGALNFRSTNVGPATGEVTVKEAYGEVLVPLARDVAWAQSLDLNAAARVTNYSTSGTVQTWKVGLTHQVVSDLRLRASISRDIAAPSLYQLFAGPSTTSGFVADIHTNTSGNLQQIVRGNTELVPEVATTYTAGAVFTPSFLPGLTLIADYYNIGIDDAIATPGNSIVDCENSGGTSPACANVVRPLPFSNRTPANFPIATYSQPINVAKREQSGVDLEGSYRFGLSALRSSWDGQLALRAVASILLDSTNQPSPTSPVEEQKGYGDSPEVRYSFSVDYSQGPARLSLSANGFSETQKSRDQIYVNYGTNPAAIYFNLSGSYKFGDEGLEAFFAIQNLEGKRPPMSAAGNNPGLQFPGGGSYDLIGRQYTVGVRASF